MGLKVPNELSEQLPHALPQLARPQPEQRPLPQSTETLLLPSFAVLTHPEVAFWCGADLSDLKITGSRIMAMVMCVTSISKVESSRHLEDL